MSDRADRVRSGESGLLGKTVPDHPARGLDDVVHQRHRLGILTVLAEAGQADFPYLRSVLELTDGNLGRHLEVLEEAGLIMISKGYHRRRPRTWATITSDGRRALDAELASMRALITRLEATGDAANGQAAGTDQARPGAAPRSEE